MKPLDAHAIEAEMRPKKSWRLSLEGAAAPDPGAEGGTGAAVWVTERDGSEVWCRRDPDARTWRRLAGRFVTVQAMMARRLPSTGTRALRAWTQTLPASYVIR